MTASGHADDAAAVPAVVIGGYLGAGKTTLVNHLLRHADGRRIAVLVNDFGDVSIDADLVVGASGDVLALAGGCFCCSFGADLVGALQRIVQSQPRPDHVLIECSGVGIPAAVARTARLARGVTIEAVVVLADATSVRERATDAFVGDTVRRQLADADLVLLNKCDALAGAERTAVRDWLARTDATLPIIETVDAAVPPALVFGLQERPPVRRALRPSPLRPLPSAADQFSSRTQRYDAPVDVHALAAALCAPQSGVLRAKGRLTGIDGRHWLLQVVGRRADLHPLPSAGAPVAGAGQLVVIGLKAPAALDG